MRSVGAVCDRAYFLILRKAGGHRPPLIITVRWVAADCPLSDTSPRAPKRLRQLRTSTSLDG